MNFWKYFILIQVIQTLNTKQKYFHKSQNQSSNKIHQKNLHDQLKCHIILAYDSSSPSLYITTWNKQSINIANPSHLINQSKQHNDHIPNRKKCLPKNKKYFLQHVCMGINFYGNRTCRAMSFLKGIKKAKSETKNKKKCEIKILAGISNPQLH